MNRAKPPGGAGKKRFSNETQRYLDDAAEILAKVNLEQKLEVKLFNTAIFDRVGVKRSFQEGLPDTFREQFGELWTEVKAFLKMGES